MLILFYFNLNPSCNYGTGFIICEMMDDGTCAILSVRMEYVPNRTGGRSGLFLALRRTPAQC